jgi:ERCC4-type nuclease
MAPKTTKTPLRLLLDVREHALHAALERDHPDLRHERCPLDLGDAQVRGPGDTLVLVLERKTLADLSASVKDGRYREQTARLLANVPRERVVYVIEAPAQYHIYSAGAGGGAAGAGWGCLPPATLRSCLLSLQFRKGVRVVVTAGPAETAGFLHSCTAYLARDDMAAFTGGQPGGWAPRGELPVGSEPLHYTLVREACPTAQDTADPPDALPDALLPVGPIRPVLPAGGPIRPVLPAGGPIRARHAHSVAACLAAAVHARKRDNLDPERCFLLQLCQLPGVSVKTAAELGKRFGTWGGLQAQLSHLSAGERLKALAGVPMVGKKTAATMERFIWQCTPA